MATCRYCGKEFERTSKLYVYCSEECQLQGYFNKFMEWRKKYKEKQFKYRQEYRAKLKEKK